MNPNTTDRIMEDLQAGRRIRVERKAVYASKTAPAARESIKTILSCERRRADFGEGAVLRLKGSKRFFRVYLAHDFDGWILSTGGKRPLQYRVIEIL